MNGVASSEMTGAMLTGLSDHTMCDVVSRYRTRRWVNAINAIKWQYWLSCWKWVPQNRTWRKVLQFGNQSFRWLCHPACLAIYDDMQSVSVWRDSGSSCVILLLLLNYFVCFDVRKYSFSEEDLVLGPCHSCQHGLTKMRDVLLRRRIDIFLNQK